MNVQNIVNCKQCGLYCNQSPLIDKLKKSDVLWVGLSAKKIEDFDNDYPLKNNTNTGKIIEKIECINPQFTYYKSNLVKCLPLDDMQKLRYPRRSEMESCFDNLISEIEYVQPKIVVLLGEIVSNYVLKKIRDIKLRVNTTFISIQHPSYISVYKKKYEQNYIDEVANRIYQVINESIKL